MEPLHAISLKILYGRDLQLERADVDKVFVEVQRSLFEELGILCPQPVLEEEAALSPRAFQLELNGTRLPPAAEIGAGDNADQVMASVEAAIRAQPGAMLNDELVEYYLSLLTANFPALVEAVRQEIGVPKLTLDLKEKLNGSTSIRNLPMILDNLLVQTLTTL